MNNSTDSTAPLVNTPNSISFFSDFEITSHSPAFTKMISDCFDDDYPIAKTYSEPTSKNSKNRAKRLRKKSKR